MLKREWSRGSSFQEHSSDKVCDRCDASAKRIRHVCWRTNVCCHLQASAGQRTLTMRTVSDTSSVRCAFRKKAPSNNEGESRSATSTSPRHSSGPPSPTAWCARNNVLFWTSPSAWTCSQQRHLTSMRHPKPSSPVRIKRFECPAVTVAAAYR